MRRRDYLRAATPLLAALAGCSGGDGGGTTTDGTTGPRESGRATLSMRLASEADRARALAVSVQHVRTPFCRFADRPCAAPIERSSVVERSPTLQPGDSVSFEEPFGLTRALDALWLSVSVDGGETRTVRGVESGVTGDPAEGHDWTFGSTAAVEATVTAGGDLTLSLGR